jgi:hypothetical protein
MKSLLLIVLFSVYGLSAEAKVLTCITTIGEGGLPIIRTAPLDKDGNGILRDTIFGYRIQAISKRNLITSISLIRESDGAGTTVTGDQSFVGLYIGDESVECSIEID